MLLCTSFGRNINSKAAFDIRDSYGVCPVDFSNWSEEDKHTHSDENLKPGELKKNIEALFKDHINLIH